MQTTDLSIYFKPELFLQKLSATTKQDVLSEMLDLFKEGQHIKNRDIVHDMLQQREKLGSTGIGKGVAIPHGRTMASYDVLIAFAKSDAGVDFDSIDNKPAHLFFMVIAPPHDDGNKYLPILGTLVTFLNNEENRAKLMQVETFEDFIATITGG